MKLSDHRISIPSMLDVGKGNLSHLGSLLKKNGFSKIVIYFGLGLYDLLGDKIMKSLEENSIEVLDRAELNDINMNEIIKKAFTISPKTEAVIAVGGGRVIDASKYMSFLRKIPFISIPTSTSNDGFSSSGASLYIDGKRTSVSAKMPYGIIVDIDVIKGSPEKFIYSGIGDLVSKITAITDWHFEEEHGKTQMDDFAVMIARKTVDSFLKLEFKSINDDLFIKELVDSLSLSGIAMEIAGDSTPASGSEHLISHALDKFSENPQLHGIQVGVATYIMSKVQNSGYEEIKRVLEVTGFFKYAKTLSMKREDFAKAIDMAPEIKPLRYTYIHIKEYREEAKRLLLEDEILKDILV